MDDAAKKEFGRLMQALCAAFTVEPSAPLLEGYWIALRSLPVEQFRLAIGRALETCRRMPSAAELRDLAGVMPPEVRATRAWEAVRSSVARHGAYASPDFDDPAINATIRNLGGWVRICSAEPDEFAKWLRKDFERVYVGFLRTGVTSQSAAPLRGLLEGGNSVPLRVQIATGLPITSSALPVAIERPQLREVKP